LIKVAFFVYFNSLMDFISALNNSESYSKIDY